MSRFKTFGTRIVSLIIIVLATTVVVFSSYRFVESQHSIESIISLCFFIIGVSAVMFSILDFAEKKWPLESTIANGEVLKNPIDDIKMTEEEYRDSSK